MESLHTNTKVHVERLFRKAALTHLRWTVICEAVVAYLLKDSEPSLRITALVHYSSGLVIIRLYIFLVIYQEDTF